MNRTLIFDNANAIMWRYPEAGIVHCQFNRCVFGEDFRECMNECANLFEKRGASKLLSDDRRNASVPDEDIEWIVSKWLPRAKAAGFRRWAMVVPERAVSDALFERVASDAEAAGIEGRSFTDLDQAMSWLLSA